MFPGLQGGARTTTAGIYLFSPAGRCKQRLRANTRKFLIYALKLFLETNSKRATPRFGVVRLRKQRWATARGQTTNPDIYEASKSRTATSFPRHISGCRDRRVAAM
jgi:hypothetical protein